ncbi:hypothetical protein, partial [Eggerthia catenaformis]
FLKSACVFALKGSKEVVKHLSTNLKTSTCTLSNADKMNIASIEKHFYFADFWQKVNFHCYRD